MRADTAGFAPTHLFMGAYEDPETFEGVPFLRWVCALRALGYEPSRWGR